MYTIQIDLEKCEGCGDCSEICPVELFEVRQENGKEFAFYTGTEDDCIGCMACETECAEGAISILEA
ncbi:MAG: ferredoxin family protein [Anaerolineales bacterium]